MIGRYYTRRSGEHGDALSALNTVFAQDGAFVYVPRGVRVARPLLVTFAHYSEDEALRCFARSLFVFERDSEAQLVIDDRSEGDGAALDCQVRELFVGSGARVELVELLRLGDRSTLVSSSFAEQWESSRLHTLSVALDGRLVRSNQQVRLLGSGAENHTNALMLCGAGEHIDFNTSLEHAAADCTSYELVKAIAADGGTGVFGGRIYVAQDAQRTQAYQQNNNLLLGDAAHVYSKPQLEIYADNVKCSHGATVSFAGTTYAELPLKFEAGTANYIGAIGLGEAIRYVEGVDREAAARYESGLTAYATEKLSAVEGLRIYGSQLDKCSILSFTIDGTHPYDVGMILDKLGIAVRTGTHCAEPVMAHYGITSMVRASLAMYNTFGEIDMLAEGLKRAARMLRS